MDMQLTLFARITRLSDSSIMRQINFQPVSFLLTIIASKRKQGRPRNTWSTEINKLVNRMFGSYGEAYNNIGYHQT